MSAIATLLTPFVPSASHTQGWRKTRLCSGCYAPTGNAGIHTWKVRLCSPCMAASILNKSASTHSARASQPHVSR